MTFGEIGCRIVDLVSYDPAYCVGLAARVIIERKGQLVLPELKDLDKTNPIHQNELVRQDLLR